jgi:hypothetical protein
MDLPSQTPLTIHGSGETRPQGAQTSRFVQMFQALAPIGRRMTTGEFGLTGGSHGGQGRLASCRAAQGAGLIGSALE